MSDLAHWWLTACPPTQRVGSDADRSLPSTTSVQPCARAANAEIAVTTAVTGMCPFRAPRSFQSRRAGSRRRAAVCRVRPAAAATRRGASVALIVKATARSPSTDNTSAESLPPPTGTNAPAAASPSDADVGRSSGVTRVGARLASISSSHRWSSGTGRSLRAANSRMPWS